MTLHDLLGRLHVEKGPTSRGEYICRCPAHDDRRASLWVREGDKGIIMDCKAGCSKDDVLRALGLTVYDLLDDETREKWDKHAARKGVDPREAYDGAPTGRKPRTTKAAPKPAPSSEPLKIRDVKTFDSYEAAYGRIGKLVCCYDYTDSNGRLLFQVARIDTPKGKTFRQHRPVNPEGGLFPIVCSVPAEVRSGIIYRQPEVDAAVKGGRTVYVVEGEKDADTLVNCFGYVGTTSPMGADHWMRSHAEHLRGADVVVIPDADASGEKYERAIVDSVVGLAKSVRVVHLRDAYAELPDKGDITDLVEIVGASTAKAMLDKLAAEAAPIQADLYKRACEVYNAMGAYCIENGCICQSLENSVRVLGTFVALPIRELTKDDGANVTKWLEIMGWAASGKPLERQVVPMAKFKAMDWAMEGWGLTANIMPGNTIRDRLRSVIAAAGAQFAERKTIYAHTGWRKIAGRWAYLYEGGCIGADAVSVEMERELATYSLDGNEDHLAPEDAAISSASMEYIIQPRVSIPLLAVTYLAPLREFLQIAGNPPAFILLLRGMSGTKKSTAAALALSHFGNFSSTTPPASFGDTANSIRRKAFVVKDMPLLIDDYHPSANIQERRKMEQTAQSLARAFGNLTSRGRLSADLSLQTNMPARSLAIMTGEELPDIGDSGIARYYVVEVEHGDVPGGGDLTNLQQRARAGDLRITMRAYIEWLLPQAETLPQQLGEMFLAYRAQSAKLLEKNNVHGRTVDAVAHLMIGLTYMLRFFVHLKLIDAEGAAEQLASYWEIIVGNSSAQVQTTREESAVQMFMRAASEMLTSRTLNVMDISDASTDRSVPSRGMCGYKDNENYYFMAETVYGATVHFYKDQERVFPASRSALLKQLREQGLVIPDNAGKATKLKRTPDGKNQRLLWIPRWRLDGVRIASEPQTPPDEQTEMDLRDADGNPLPF